MMQIASFAFEARKHNGDSFIHTSFHPSQDGDYNKVEVKCSLKSKMFYLFIKHLSLSFLFAFFFAGTLSNQSFSLEGLTKELNNVINQLV